MHRKILGVIPARYASSRFQGKALATVGSRTLLELVWERVCMARYLGSVIVATDDDRISRVARGFGAHVRMTRNDHVSGTDRVAEVASAYEDAELVVNIQGDEPLIDPNAIDAAILPLLEEPAIPMGTLKKRIENPHELNDPNVVKVVTDRFENAIYFSRANIPFVRDAAGRDTGAGGNEITSYKHIGLYVYRRDFLLRYSALPIGPLEQLERLEQLRALENGFRIRVVETDYESIGVDTPEDLEKVRALISAGEAAVARG
ncbi:MAG TPA: 3-deoxy-manno-octulosonate cytidylyltransferase [Bryobacteraceae bacterium]|nr:3-deoxy-manno-octulosonate cytidylyltransferase [Bryobacteraceae bacterium]